MTYERSRIYQSSMGESDPNTPSVADVEELKDKLDLLWEKYLNFLDQYDQAQRQLGKQMSSVRKDKDTHPI